MEARQPFFSALIILSLLSSFAYADSQGKSYGFTLQVAAFPETAESEAESFITKIAEAGEQPIWGTIDIPGRGNWIRVFIGTFKTQIEARQYGEQLLTRRLIKEFLIKKSSEIKALSRPRSVIRKDASHRQPSPADVAEHSVDVAASEDKSARQESLQSAPGAAKLPVRSFRSPPNEVAARPPTPQANQPPSRDREPAPAPNHQLKQTPNQQPTSPPKPSEEFKNPKGLNRSLPPSSELQEPATVRGKGVRASNISLFNNIASGRFAFALTTSDHKRTLLRLAPAIDLQAVPRADAISAVFDLIAPKSPTPDDQPGGLWLGGDTEEGLERLRWILGTDADLLGLDHTNRVYLDLKRLASRIGVYQSKAADAPLKVLNYITANEGLLLLVQLTQSRRRYQLYLGNQVITRGGYVKISGSINLDNNFDARINLHRRNQVKLDLERPPESFDSLIGINPAARWFNLHTNRLVPDGNITFHELAEAFAKVEYGYEYLPSGAMPGAHQIALDREIQLKAQRPDTDVVLTLGSNRVIKSEEEWKQFAAEIGGVRQQ
jgi:hypothetical protein